MWTNTMMAAAVAGAVAMLGGCATTSRGEAPLAAADATIRYETSPCYGTCPVYAVTIRPDGTGTFEGQRFTAAAGMRSFTASPGVYRRFAAALAPYRPAGGERLYRQGTPLCPGPMVSDMPSVDVRWTAADGGEQHMSYDFGCGNDPAMAGALRNAPDILPIAAFVTPTPPND